MRVSAYAAADTTLFRCLRGTDLFCTVCGKEVSSDASFCQKCGRRIVVFSPRDINVGIVSPAGIQRKGTSASWVKLIFGFLSLMVCFWILYQIDGLGDLESHLEPPTRQSKYETFKVGYWEYRINRVTELPTLGKGDFLRRANGRFVVVFLTVKNNDSSPSTLPGPQRKDTMNRQHSSEIVIETDLPANDLTLTTLNPGVAKSGYFIFDVPDDARGLDLILSGGVRSGEKAIVAL